MKPLLATAVFLAASLGATAANANPALVTTDLNLRTGPSTGYPVVTAMPDGAIVDVAGCTRGYNWCRVDWNGYNGWASSHYLAQRSGRYDGRVYSNYGAEIGIPLIAGAVIGSTLGYHHNHYYRDDYRHFRHYRRHRHHRRHLRHLRHRLRHERRHLRHVRRHERRFRRHHHRHH